MDLVEAMNRVHELDRRNAGRAAVDAALQRLVELTKAHFADEEKHMAAIGYKDLVVHSRIHADMLRKVAAHYETFRAGSGAVAKEFFDFLVLWLGAHIMGIDRKYAPLPTASRA